jgi:hypothetical protein
VPQKGVSQAAAVPSGPPAIESGTLPWQLAAPISREVVLPDGTADNLLIAGGLDSAGSSASGVYALDTLNGRLSLVGSLPVATHDAAGAVTRHGSLVLGGGNTVPISTTQRIATGGSPLTSGSLPEARADSAAVTISGTAFVVGGYNGLTLDPEVLATTDGLHFDNVAALAVPVRYPAVAALNGKIYVFGGQGSNGRPVGAVQVVDPVSRRVAVIGQLPSPVTGAVAVDLGGTLYVAGGESGVGTAPLRPCWVQLLPYRLDQLRRGAAMPHPRGPLVPLPAPPSGARARPGPPVLCLLEGRRDPRFAPPTGGLPPGRSGPVQLVRRRW